MDYYLNRQGQTADVVSLEELRRRREAGELSGAELVWRQGMAQWQSLDSVLGSVSPLGAPPPIPRSARKPGPNPVVLWLVVLGVLCCVGMAIFFGVQITRGVSRLGITSQLRGQPGNDVALASQPVTWKPNTLTASDSQKRARAFRIRQYLEGYKQRGRRDEPCDAEALQFIEAWIDQNYGGTQKTNQPEAARLADELVANPACDDPLVLAAAAAASRDGAERIRRLERAVAGFESSKHRAYPRFYATVTLAHDLANDLGRRASLEASAVELFSRAFTDGSFLPEDQAEIAEVLVTGWGYNFFYRRGQAVSAAASAAGKSYGWLASVLDGEYHLNEAWRERGGGFADTVTTKGWEGFARHLAAARESFTRAWNLHPDQPLAPAMMVYVAMGDSGLEQMRLWFDRAVAAQIDQPAAWSNMRWGLRPRWHGSLDSMLAFGVVAANTKRFDTDVPRKLYDSITDMESELSVAPGQHIYGRDDIWPHLKGVYEGYIAEPSQAAQRNGWRGTYAALAYLAGHYDVARQQLEALNWEISSWSLAGWGAELSLLPLEVAARTGPVASQIGEAETSYRAGDAAAALDAYQKLITVTNMDERTAKFIRCRVASLEQEKRLAQGQWVDFLPTQDDDLIWVCQAGKSRALGDGALAVENAAYGHLLFSRTRVGSEFAVKGQFEIDSSSNKVFQEGLAMGLPDWNNDNWHAFRMKHNDAEHDVASFSRAWGTQEVSQPVKLNDGRNDFEFRFQAGKASAWVNGVEVFQHIKPPSAIRVGSREFFLGLGGYGDSDQPVIYRNLQVRRISPSEKTPGGQRSADAERSGK